VERRIRPSTTNHAITRWDQDHLVWYDATPRSAHRLLVVLPGTGGAPGNLAEFPRVAVGQGYDVIGLMYPDDLAVVTACAGDPRADCMEAMRREIIEGIDSSPHVAVDPPNSIDGRLVALLRYLGTRFPAERWMAYLDGDAPRWDAIAVSGLSQGGGHAAMIARLRAVPRVIMFGAPADGFNGEVAPWMSIGATPADRYFGFAHVRDPFTSIGPNWRALGLDAFGDVALVEDGVAAGGSHMLRTDLRPRTGSYDDAHSSVVGDFTTPRAPDGSPVFAAAWRYFVGRAEN